MSPRYLIVMAVLAANLASAGGLTLSSPALKPGGRLAQAQVYNGYGCSGGNISPALSWSGAPAGTRSFVLTVFDPDAPTGHGWWHWAVFNLPSGSQGLVEGAGGGGRQLPAGAVQAQTDFGKPGYGGACPPAGDKPHRYVFTIYALGVDKLPLDASATAATVDAQARRLKLDSASLTVLYGR